MQISSAIATWIDTVIPNIRSHSITQSGAFNSRSGIAFARFPEALIRYRVVGKGPQTLVLATDPPVVIEQYDELLEILEPDFRVIVFEIPGFGFSMPQSGFSFDFAQLNNLVAEFLYRLDMGPYILAFPCVAAYGAIDVAKRFPELVDGVVLLQAPSWREEVKWKHGLDKRQILSKPIIGQLTLQLLKRKRVSQWFDAAVGKKERLSEFVETTDRALEHGACFCLASAFQHYLTDSAPALATISQPTLIVWGEADRSHRRTDKSSSKLYCQNAEELRFQDAGHFPELEEPEMFSKAVKVWARTFRTQPRAE
jgi:pimeloyl-ACP methyl ester carboxylesterase